MQLSVKGVNEKVFREFKAETVREGLNVGSALGLAMKMWVEKVEKKPKISILNLKPSGWGKGTEKLSEKSDSVLYGED